MIQIPQDFREFLRLLNYHHVEYLLIGGYAVGYYGFVRATGDMDIWVKISPNNATQIVKALQEFGFAVPELSYELFMQEEKIIRMGVPPLRLEILTTISGVDFVECFQNRLTDQIDGIDLTLSALKRLRFLIQRDNLPNRLTSN